MSYGEPPTSAVEADRDGAGAPVERLSLGVAARLSRYLQVLTQAKKMGKETISSQELSDYTHVNSTQIRRDLFVGLTLGNPLEDLPLARGQVAGDHRFSTLGCARGIACSLS